jgi:hypothetical protein
VQQFVLLQQLQMLLLQSNLVSSHVCQVLVVAVQQIPIPVDIVTAYIKKEVQVPITIYYSPEIREFNSLRLTRKDYLYSSIIGVREDFT